MKAGIHNLEDIVRRMTPIAAPQAQRSEVVALSKALADQRSNRPRGRSRCRLVSHNGKSVAVPTAVIRLLERVVEVLARGDSITVVPVDREVTSQTAADLLNVSRQYLVRLLDAGEIPYRMTGAHRRIRVEDVVLFKRKRDKDRRAGLRKLSQLTQEFDGYDPESK